MASFPRIAELPSLVDTIGWDWTRFKAPSKPSDHFWQGTDRTGNRWLTKLTGSFCAYREIVFGRLAQQMNWSCQSSVFMRVDSVGAALLNVTPGSIHAAHWFLEEHVFQPCDDGCSLLPLIGREIRHVEDLNGISVAHLIDWPKSEMAACLFGGNEPPGRLFTKSHEFVIIDSELMFSSLPSSFDCTTWWGEVECPRLSGLELAHEVCSEFIALGESSLEAALALPPGVSIEERWQIAPLVRESLAYALSFRSLNLRA